MDYAALIDRIRDRPDFALLQTVLLRSLSQAQYSPDNVGHFGLAYDAYAHFTSPIRRYPDLLVHRAIKAVLAGRHERRQAVPGRESAPPAGSEAAKPASAGGPYYQPKGVSWSELGVHASMTERRADDASRDVLQWLKCHYMQEKVGESFAGTISGVASFGIFVTLDGLDIDGLVHVTELPRDYFHFDAVRHALIGERSGRVFQLAGRVTVKVARVDLERAKIDFTLDDTIAADAAAPLGSGRPVSLQAAQPAMPKPTASEALAAGAGRPRARKSRR
jgi:ribonuclease R